MKPLAPTALVFSSLACDASQPATPSVPARIDSAGIEIVESLSAAWNEDSRWTLADEPALEIGGTTADSAAEFASIQGVHRLASGAIAVVDAWAYTIAFFDGSGRFLGRAGRQGSGPGEFPPRSIRSTVSCGGDTVFVVAAQRMSGFSPPGQFVRSMTPVEPTNVRACGAHGVIGEVRFGARRTSPGVFTDSILLVAFGPDGARTAVIDTLPWQVGHWVTGPEGLGYSRQVFSPTLAVAARDTRMATGYGDRFVIEVRDGAGLARRIIRIRGHERTVSASDVDAFARHIMNVQRATEQDRNRIIQRINAAAGGPRPTFAELRFDSEGNLWAREYDHLDAVAFFDYSRLSPSYARPEMRERRRWLVIDSTGHYLGPVDMPANFTVFEIGSDHVLGVWRNDLDVQSIRQYRLKKPAT